MTHVSIGLTDETRIAQIIKGLGIKGLHATNGTYAYAQAMILPTTLAGFQYICDIHPNDDAALAVAVNSNASMQAMYAAKGASEREYDELEDQHVRANKVVLPLLKQFPGRHVITLFYDKPDPADLYAGLGADGRIRMHSLHKWGYGTGDNPKPILGAENFENVYGFPMPASVSHILPVAWNVTPEGQKGYVQVVDLTRAQGPHGAAYLTSDNRMLFGAGAGQGAAASGASLKPAP